MPNFEYRVVPFVGQLKQGVFNKENAVRVGEQLAQLISENVKDGWEYYRMDHATAYYRAGCLARLFLAGRGDAAIVFDQVIFHRTIA